MQLQNLKDEIKLYEDSKWKFVSYSLAEASQVENNTEDGKEPNLRLQETLQLM